MMPTRRRTRIQTRAARITAERRLNATERALNTEATTAQPPREACCSRTPYQFRPADHTPDYGDDPPPF